MIKTSVIIAACALLAGCAQLGGATGSLLGVEAGESKGGREVLTRAQIDQSGVALIRAQIVGRETSGRFYFAQADNNNTVTYGKGDRSYLVVRGGLLVGTHGFGNDIITVASNANDPVQFQRPATQWPGEIERVYHLPGDGLDGEQISMHCRYSNSGNGQIEIIEQTHSATLMTEICTSELGVVENSYMVGADGFIWKSEQFAGRGTEQVIIEIVEPLT